MPRNDDRIINDRSDDPLGEDMGYVRNKPKKETTKGHYGSDGKLYYSNDEPGTWISGAGHRQSFNNPVAPDQANPQNFSSSELNFAKGGAVYKHSDPNHLNFGKSADSKLLAKRRRNFEDGGMAVPVPDFTPPPGSTTCTASSSGSAALHPWCGSEEDMSQKAKAGGR